MSFYLNGNYISDSYLRYLLLHNEKEPDLREEINGNDTAGVESEVDYIKRLLSKLNFEITELNTEGLLIRLKDVLTRQNLNIYSTLTSLTKKHLLAVLYLLYEGRITEKDVIQIISSTNVKSRTELLLSFLKTPANTQYIDFFKPLLNHASKMAYYINPYEKEPTEKTTIFSDVQNTYINHVDGTLSFGNYYYADKGKDSLFQYCNSLYIGNTVYTEIKDSNILPDSKYKSMLTNNSFNINNFDSNKTRITLFNLLTPIYSWVKVIRETELEVYFNRQTTLERYTYNNSRLLFKYSINPEYLNSFNKYKEVIDRGYGLLSFLDDELDKDRVINKTEGIKKFSERLANAVFSGKKFGYNVSFSKENANHLLKLDLSNVYMYSLNESLIKVSNEIFKNRTNVRFKNIIVTSEEVKTSIQKGYKQEFDSAIVRERIGDSNSESIVSRIDVPTNRISNRNVFSDYGFEINYEGEPDYATPLKELFNFNLTKTNGLESDINFLSLFLNVQNSVGEYYKNSNVSNLLKNIIDLDILIDDSKEVVNFGTTNLSNILLDMARQVSSDIKFTVEDLTGDISYVKQKFIDNYKDLKVKTEANFYDMFLFYISKDIIGNYILYLFPDVELEGRMCTISEFDSLKSVFNIKNSSLDSTDSDVRNSVSLFSIYVRIFKLRHMIMNLKTVENRIVKNNLFIKMLSDPCNCNRFFEGACVASEMLHSTNNYIDQHLDKDKYLSRETFDGFKTHTINYDTGSAGVIKC